MSRRNRSVPILLALGLILAVAATGAGGGASSQEGPERWYVAEPTVGSSATVACLHLIPGPDGIPAADAS